MASYTGVFTQQSPMQGQQQNYAPLQEQYFQFTERYNHKQKVVELFQVVGLVGTTEGDKALKDFHSAWDVYLQKPKSALSSLIPLRNALEETVNQLLQMRRKQEPTSKKERVEKILSQVREKHVQDRDIVALQQKYTDVHDKLSGAKSHYTRTEEQALMAQGTEYLIALLSAVDPAKLRR